MTDLSARPTLAQVAERAHVSIASVSRVISGASASPAMVERVTKVATELGYVPDARARSLKVGRTEQLALAVADLGNPVYVAMMRAIELVVRDAGYRLVVSSTGASVEEEMEVIGGLQRGYADGLILSPLRIDERVLDQLRRSRVPAVVIGMLPPGAGLDNVRTSSARGVGLAVEHLISGGRRRIALVNGPSDTVPGRERERGFVRAMTNAGREVVHVAADDFTHPAGDRATTELLHHHRFDALVCANDLLAIGAMRALQRSGRSVPGDVAVVGMDDTDLAELATPSLTSVSLGSARRGRLAATMLLDRLADPDRPPRRTTAQPELIVRDSSGPAKRLSR